MSSTDQLRELLAAGYTPQQLLEQLQAIQREELTAQLTALNQRKTTIEVELRALAEQRATKQAQLAQLQNYLATSPAAAQVVQTWQALQAQT